MAEPEQPQTAAGQWVEQRPETELARGQYAWPAWGVVVLGAAIVLAGAAYLLMRWRRRQARS